MQVRNAVVNIISKSWIVLNGNSLILMSILYLNVQTYKCKWQGSKLKRNCRVKGAGAARKNQTDSVLGEKGVQRGVAM